MDKKKEAQIINEYTKGKTSYRMLGKKYGVGHMRISRVIKSNQEIQQKTKEKKAEEDYPLPDDIETLKEELRKARLKIELQDIMIDIASKELGVDLRKKHGARQSR